MVHYKIDPKQFLFDNTPYILGTVDEEEYDEMVHARYFGPFDDGFVCYVTKRNIEELEEETLYTQFLLKHEEILSLDQIPPPLIDEEDNFIYFTETIRDYLNFIKNTRKSRITINDFSKNTSIKIRMLKQTKKFSSLEKRARERRGYELSLEDCSQTKIGREFADHYDLAKIVAKTYILQNGQKIQV